MMTIDVPGFRVYPVEWIADTLRLIWGRTERPFSDVLGTVRPTNDGRYTWITGCSPFLGDANPPHTQGVCSTLDDAKAKLESFYPLVRT